MKKLIILGCGGFVGSHLIDRLLASGEYHIEGWDISFDKIAQHRENPNLSFHQRYINADTTFEEIEPYIADAEAVISLAAICTPAQYVSSPVKTIHSNFIDAYALIDLCAKHKSWLMHTSTCEVYGRTLSSYVPTDDYDDPDLYEQREDETPLIMGPSKNHRWSYATAKQLFERYIFAHNSENGLPFTIIRPYNWFGPRMDFIPGRDGEGVPRVLACFMTALLDGKPMQLVDGGDAYRTITYIDDAIDALQKMLEGPKNSRDQVFNIGNRGGEVTMKGLAHLMRELAAEITGKESFLSHPIEDITGNKFYGEGYEDCDRRVPDISKAESLLGWRAKTNLRETLRITMADYFERYGRD
ncbi:MAG: NAD-dependent epimerase/dehydratase family protein [Deltaproteobacteria bacterium]|nr:NAD-dependent epimerase/dehydratase family protein [Deltaproteobacteria bacterium]MBW2395962.1 NAD-dependent epimerase/dehydratase family protein [Deltaproteobacteria bacterium]